MDKKSKDIFLLCLFTSMIVAFVVSIAIVWATNIVIIDKFITHNKQTAIKVANIERLANVASIVRVTVTAYSPRRRETDSTPFINASMQKVQEGDIAVSRDLFKKGWVFGKRVWVEGLGLYVISDLMNTRYENRIDIFMHKTRKARKFGVKNEIIAALLEL